MACLLLLALAHSLGRPVAARALGGAPTRVELASAGLGSAASEYQLGNLRRSFGRPEALLESERSQEEWFFGRRRRSRSAVNLTANETPAEANDTDAAVAQAAVDAASAAAAAGASPEEIAEAAAAAAKAANTSANSSAEGNSTEAEKESNSTKAGHKWCPSIFAGWLCKKSNATGNVTYVGSSANNDTSTQTTEELEQEDEEEEDLVKKESTETEDTADYEDALETNEITKTKLKKKGAGARRRRGQAVLLATGQPKTEGDEAVATARSPLTDPFARRIDQLLGKSQ